MEDPLVSGSPGVRWGKVDKNRILHGMQSRCLGEVILPGNWMIVLADVGDGQATGLDSIPLTRVARHLCDNMLSQMQGIKSKGIIELNNKKQSVKWCYYFVIY